MIATRESYSPNLFSTSSLIPKPLNHSAFFFARVFELSRHLSVNFQESREVSSVTFVPDTIVPRVNLGILGECRSVPLEQPFDRRVARGKKVTRCFYIEYCSVECWSSSRVGQQEFSISNDTFRNRNSMRHHRVNLDQQVRRVNCSSMVVPLSSKSMTAHLYLCQTQSIYRFFLTTVLRPQLNVRNHPQISRHPFCTSVDPFAEQN